MQEKNSARSDPENGDSSSGGIINYEYDTLMSSLKVSVSKHLLDEYFSMVWANDFYYKTIRYPKAEYEEQFHNRPDIYYNYHHYMDELKLLSEAVSNALERNEPGYSLVTRLPVKGGGHVWVRMTGTFVDEVINGFRVSYTVITNIDDLVRIQTDQSITYNNIPGFVARFLFKGDEVEVLSANDRFCNFFGGDIGSAEFQELFHKNWDNNKESITPLLGNVPQGKPFHLFVRVQGRTGEYAWMQVSGDCVDWIGGSPVYLMIYIDVTDITDMRQMQLRLEEQAKRLREALQAAENANRAKSDFLSRMSHDIRTPMNAIVGMTEIAGAHLDDPDKVKDCLHKISISSQHLLGLINDVLDMSKIESGKMALNNEALFLPELMENVVAIIQPMIKARKQNFSIRLKNLNHEHFFCDALRLRQCFINILSNASKFTPEGGSITLDMEETESKWPGRADVIFTFTDTGIGIKPEFVSHIFDTFTRERDGRVDKIEGSGLGMAITKKIVDMMDGTIQVRSRLNEGTVFEVRIPMIIDDHREETEPELPAMKVLLADDDEIMCEYTSQILLDLGMRVKWVNRGLLALEEVLKAHEEGEDYEAVILDWSMPDLDGVETVREIRSRLGAGIPILIVSAYEWGEIEHEARAAGANGFLSKPLFRSTLCRGLYRYVMGQKEQVYLRSNEKEYDFSGNRILLVEDNELNREIAVELLSDVGISVETAVNGQEGLDKFNSSPLGYYHLILMDLQMPVMDGYTATRKIRGLDRHDASVPILAMTADAFAEDILATREAGMNGHLTKPLDVAAMKREIQRYFENRSDSAK